MPTSTGFSRPTLADQVSRVQGDINSLLEGADSRTRRSILSVIAIIQAGGVHELYGYLDWVADQGIIDTAESAYLDRYGAIYKVPRLQPTASSGINAVTINGISGSSVLTDVLLQRADGIQFQITEGITLSGTSGTVNVTATTSGSITNTDVDTVLTFVTPQAGIADTATVTTALTGGSDQETDADYLPRILAKIQTPPQGGAVADYIAWAESIAGVTRVWVTQEMGPSTVTIRFMMDETYTNGIPESGDVTNVQNYINTVRPVTATVYVVAPIANPLNFTIHLNEADSPTIRAAVQAELADLITREAVPEGTMLLTHIQQAIATSAGVIDYVLSSPTANVTNTTGYITTMGTITWD